MSQCFFAGNIFIPLDRDMVILSSHLQMCSVLPRMVRFYPVKGSRTIVVLSRLTFSNPSVWKVINLAPV